MSNQDLVALDFEYRDNDDYGLYPVCVVFMSLKSGHKCRIWLVGRESLQPPLWVQDAILIGHALTPAEARCWQTLGWPEPAGWIDTFIEEKRLAAGERLTGGFGLLACCQRRGIPCIVNAEKEAMRDLVLRGGEYSDAESLAILDYCESDVRETAALFKAIEPELNLDQALFRGRSAVEFARIGDRGIPADVERVRSLQKLGKLGLRQLWQDELDVHNLMQFGKFDTSAYGRFIEINGLADWWPRTATGKYKSDDNTLKEAATAYGEPWLAVRELIKSLTQGGCDGLKLRRDGRLYAAPKPFMTITSRCAPSSSEFVLLATKWQRSLIQPAPGRCVMEFDYSNQEYAVAAALSQDPKMIEAYRSGDPYMSLAKLAGAVPANAEKKTHPKEREMFKVVSLAVLMGMGPMSIGRGIGKGLAEGKELLGLHKKVFSRFWMWVEAVERTVACRNPIETAFGLIHNPTSPEAFNPRAARNFPLQATGADMLRVAILLLADAGIRVIATLHDAVMIECEEEDVEETKAMTIKIMEEASRIALWGRLTVRVDSPEFSPETGENRCPVHPQHYQCAKGVVTWRKLAKLLNLPLDNLNG